MNAQIQAIKQAAHPASIGPQNQHMLDSMSVAYRAALHLANEGYTVLDVTLGRRNPIVVIQTCGRCNRLRGSSAAVRHGPNGREQVMVAIIHGAQVEWVVRGH